MTMIWLLAYNGSNNNISELYGTVNSVINSPRYTFKKVIVNTEGYFLYAFIQAMGIVKCLHIKFNQYVFRLSSCDKEKSASPDSWS